MGARLVSSVSVRKTWMRALEISERVNARLSCFLELGKNVGCAVLIDRSCVWAGLEGERRGGSLLSPLRFQKPPFRQLEGGDREKGRGSVC